MAAIVSFFSRVMSRRDPSANVANYYKQSMTSKDLLVFLGKHVSFGKHKYSAQQISNWLSNLPQFDEAKKIRQGSEVIRGKDLWILRNKFFGNAVKELFNYKSFLKHIQHDNLVNVGYVRKSKTKETVEKRVDLLQKMVDHLRKKSLCRKVFISAWSNADDPLFGRDEKPNASMKTVTVKTLSPR